MTVDVRPTVKDVSRAVAKLNEVDHTDAREVARLKLLVADNLGFVIGGTVRLGKVTRRDVQMMLAAAGATDFVVERYSTTIAGALRGNFTDRRLSAFV